MHERPLRRPDRVRVLERPFGWLPLRLLNSGLLERLPRPAKLLYFFLCLVADRRGVSWYRDARVRSVLQLTAVELSQARAALVREDVLAYDGGGYQLLSWPEAGPVAGPRPDGAGRRPAEVAEVGASPVPPASPPERLTPAQVSALVHQLFQDRRWR